MKKLKLEKMKNFELKNIGSIWGGVNCNKYTQKVDYTTTNSGTCEVDETCWECDDVVAGTGGGTGGAGGTGAGAGGTGVNGGR